MTTDIDTHSLPSPIFVAHNNVHGLFILNSEWERPIWSIQLDLQPNNHKWGAKQLGRRTREENKCTKCICTSWNDTFIFSHNHEEHWEQIQEVIECLKECEEA